jgi:hypothetical protein
MANKRADHRHKQTQAQSQAPVPAPATDGALHDIAAGKATADEVSAQLKELEVQLANGVPVDQAQLASLAKQAKDLADSLGTAHAALANH